MRYRCHIVDGHRHTSTEWSGDPSLNRINDWQTDPFFSPVNRLWSDEEAGFSHIDVLARFTSLSFGQLGATLGDRLDWVDAFALFSTGKTTHTLRFVAGTFLGR